MSSSSKFCSLFIILVILCCKINGNLQDDCANEKCCKTRKGIENKLCKSMTLEECVNNDNDCYWNCDDEEDDLSFLSSRGHGKFVGYSNGEGKIHQYEKNDKDNNNDENSESNIKSAKEYIDYTSYRVFGKCGDVYEYKLPTSVAQGRLNKLIDNNNNKKDISNDYKTNEKINVNKISSNEEGINDNNDEEERRRLDIFTPDGRTQSTIKNTWPYRTIGLLVTSSGSCSATLISRRVILTAGHCVYDTINNQFISNIKFYPDATSISDITTSNQYTSSSTMVFNGWIDVTCCSGSSCCNSAFDFDMALVRLSVSNTNKGWLNFGYDSGLSAPQYLNTYGYPGDKSYGTKWGQFCEYTQFNTNTFSSNICDVVGGQSGSCVYKYLPSIDSRIIYGTVNAGSSTSNTYCRITSSKYSTMCDFITSGETAIC